MVIPAMGVLAGGEEGVGEFQGVKKLPVGGFVEGWGRPERRRQREQ